MVEKYIIGGDSMFEIIQCLLGVVFIVILSISLKRIHSNQQALLDLEKKKVLALVNLRESISKLNDDLVNLEVDCLFKK